MPIGIMIIPTIILVFLLAIALIGGVIYLIILSIKALSKYLQGADDVHKENITVRKSLGQVLKDHRIRCKMTQEFVAEQLDVSRQAVSKWENGTSDPSTSNLLALAKLYGISGEELLKETTAHRPRG